MTWDSCVWGCTIPGGQILALVRPSGCITVVRLCRSLKKGRVRRRVASILYGLLIISIPAQFLVDLDPEKPCAVDAGDEDGGIAGGGSP